MEEQTTTTEVQEIPTRNDLGQTELQVLQMVSDGLTNIQIAQALKVSVRTIETRRATLITKTGTTNTATLIKYACRNNLVN